MSEVPPRLHLKPPLHYRGSKCGRGLHGEADLIVGDTVVDFKCSSRAHDFSWFCQTLAYAAMVGNGIVGDGHDDDDEEEEEEDTNSTRIQRVQVFNPLLQTIWEFDCHAWNTRTEFLDYLLGCAAAPHEG
jgi:hypothetical protein